MLKLLAYVLLAAYNDKRMADSLSMAFSPENIKSSHDVFISLFGELKIHTSHGVLPESDLKSPKISRLLTFMLLSNKKALSALEIVQEIWPEELEDKDEPGKKVKQLVYRLRQAFSIISDEQIVCVEVHQLLQQFINCTHKCEVVSVCVVNQPMFAIGSRKKFALIQ